MRGWPWGGYHRDIGNLASYMQANADLLQGEVKLQIPGNDIGGRIYAEEGVDVAPGAQIFGPVYLGHEAKIREGLLHERWPASFPSGQGSDLAGVVEQVGDGVADVAVGDQVIGFTDNRASQAELVVVEAANLTPKPAGVPWEVAGALFVVGATVVILSATLALRSHPEGLGRPGPEGPPERTTAYPAAAD